MNTFVPDKITFLRMLFLYLKEKQESNIETLSIPKSITEVEVKILKSSPQYAKATNRNALLMVRNKVQNIIMDKMIDIGELKNRDSMSITMALAIVKECAMDQAKGLND